MANLSYNKLKNSSVSEIYNYLNEDYKNLFKSYNYIFNNYSDFIKVVNNIISDIIINLPNKSTINYKNYLLNQSKIRLNKYVKDMLDSENKITILSSYINININENQNELNELKKFISWLQKIDYNIDPSDIIELITNNQKLKNILSKIIDKNIVKIKKYGLENVFTEEIIFEFLDIYCNCNYVEHNEILDIDYDESIYEKDIEKLKGTAVGAYAIIEDIKKQDLPVLSIEEEQDLFLQLKNGREDAYNKILKHNLRLVISIARRYLNRGLEYEDLIQEGNIGLLKAISKYDVSKGFKFSTYASWWIRQAITRAIGNMGRNIRLPIHKVEKLKKFREQVNELTTNLGYEPSYIEIAEKLGINYDTVKENFELLQLPASLNAKIGEDEEAELGDFIPSQVSSNLEDDIINENLVTEIDELLVKAGLTEIERDILKYHYGLNYTEEKVLEEIGKIYGITRERIRQRESKAIIKLRKYLPTTKFSSYLDNPDKAQVQLAKLRHWHYEHPKSNVVYNIDVNNYPLPSSIDDIPKKYRKLKTIYAAIPDYSKEEINKAITYLSEEDQKIFYLRNGTDLDNPKYAGDIKYLSVNYNSVVEKLKKILKRSYRSKIKTIYEHFPQYSKKDIDKAILMLNDYEKEVIFYRYGHDLEHPVTSSLWNAKEYSKILYVTIFQKIKRNINKNNDRSENKKMLKKLSIYERLSSYSREEIDAEIEKLKPKEKEIFYLRNGTDLDNPKSSSEFTNSMKTRYYNIVDKIESNLKYPKKFIRGTIYYQLELLNPKYTKEEMDKAISLLDDSEKAIIVARYGSDLEKPVLSKDRKFSYGKLKIVLNHIINILNNMFDSKVINEELIVSPKKQIKEKEVSKELREFYIRTIELLKQPVFMKLLLNLSIKDAIILAMIILSYLENREINLEDIANLLEVDINTIRKDYQRMLILFKENINEYLLGKLDNSDSIKR